MTDLAEIALDFCRSCLRWDDARALRNGFIARLPAGKGQLDAADLNAVMGAVRGWCDKSGCDIELRYSADQGGYGVLCEGVDTWDKNPCHALLAACVAASRKMKGAG